MANLTYSPVVEYKDTCNTTENLFANTNKLSQFL